MKQLTLDHGTGGLFIQPLRACGFGVDRWLMRVGPLGVALFANLDSSRR